MNEENKLDNQQIDDITKTDLSKVVITKGPWTCITCQKILQTRQEQQDHMNEEKHYEYKVENWIPIDA